MSDTAQGEEGWVGIVEVYRRFNPSVDHERDIRFVAEWGSVPMVLVRRFVPSLVGDKSLVQAPE